MEPIFEQIKQESIRDKVYSAIRQAILSGRLHTGQRLTEVRLAREFNVSRAIVREALQQLAHEGLVRQNSYKGTRVVDLSPQEIDEILSIRLLLEDYAVRHAKKNLSEADKKELRAILRKLKVLGDPSEDPQTFAQLDLALHMKIWEMCGNKTVARVLEQITTPLFAMGSIMRYADRPSSKARQPGDHSDLVEKICDGSEEEACSSMQAHLAQNWELLRKNLEEFLSSR